MTTVERLEDFAPRVAGPWPCSALLVHGPTRLVAYHGPNFTEGHVEGAARRIVAFDVATRAVEQLLEPATTIERFIVSDDGRRFAALSVYGDAHVWDADTLAPLGTWNPYLKRDLFGDFLPQAMFSPDGRWLIAVRHQNDVIIPESIVRVALDRPMPKQVARADAIALADLRRPITIVKVEPNAAAVWIAHHWQPGVERIAFGGEERRSLLRKNVVDAAVPIAGYRFLLTSRPRDTRRAAGGSRRRPQARGAPSRASPCHRTRTSAGQRARLASTSRPSTSTATWRYAPRCAPCAR